jgi:hypothetical protein
MMHPFLRARVLFMVVTLLCLNGRLKAQDFISDDFLENIEKNAAPLWNEAGAAFSNNTIPDKYKNESAVVIGFKRNVSIDKKSRNGFLSRGERSLLFLENVRFKIKLYDRNAVQGFTTIYFRYSDKLDGFSAKVYKHDGEVLPVLLDEAVSVESSSDIPEFFKSFFDQQSGSQRRYYKVAIPNLEPGDILEYVTVTQSKLDVSGNGYIEFSPQYELCNKNYPILFNQIGIETDDKSYFKSLSLNGAAAFKKEPSTENGFFRYVFTDTDRGVEKDVNFVNTYQVYPLCKFQVIYANSEKEKGALIGQKGEIKTSFSKEELARKAWEDYEQVGELPYGNYGSVQKYIDYLWSDLKKLGAKDWTEKEYINKAYYRLRNVVLNRDTYLSDKTAAYIFGSLLYQRDIKSELVISISNSIGTLNDVLFDQEIRYACKVKDQLYFNCTDYSNPGEKIESLLGSEAFIISEPTKGKNSTQEIKPFTLADANSTENNSTNTIVASLSADLNTLQVSREAKHNGINKSREIADALKYTPYMLDDYKNYGGENPTEKMREQQQEEYLESVRALKDNFKEAKPDYVKRQLQREFGKEVKYKNFALTTDGRSLKASELTYTESFEIMGMVRKAGKKLLVNVSGLVGTQLQIKKEERVRKYPVNVGYARTLNWKIRFKIPAGYKAEGLTELNTKVDNATGSFSCIAEEKDGEVVLQITKVYKQAQMPKESWTEMLAFIDAAYNHSYKYILLKPTN